MELSELYPSGTPLREVNPTFRGMPRREWQRLKVFERAATQPKGNPEDAPLSKQRVWTPRDSYGMKGF